MIICYHRHIENWKNKTEINLIEGILTSNSVESFMSKKNKWDRQFNLSLFDFRHRVQLIHLENIRNAGMVQINDFDHLIDTVGNDDIVVPSDDDDWFNPDIEYHLQNSPIQHSIDVIVWNYYTLNFNEARAGTSIYRKDKDVISCGYALTGNALKRCYQIKGRDFVYQLLHYHWFVKQCNMKTKCVNEILSLYNYHCGSVSQLNNKNLRLKNATGVFPKNDANWVKPYIAQLYKLYEESGLFKHKLT